jgi:hypothetical protein
MSEFTPDEICRLRELLDIEEIRKLGLLYSQLQDHGYLDRLAEIFTADAVCEFGPYGVWEGRETIRANYATVQIDLGGQPFAALHANAHHWIEMTAPGAAVGRRYLLDMLTTCAPEQNPLLWLGVYDEAYRKEGGAWKISRCSLQFLWPQRHLTPEFAAEFPPRAPAQPND